MPKAKPSRDGYKSLKEGDPVEFDVEVGSSGKDQAANVIRLGSD